jgi:predicted adenine nucleotide alpha hydrolase (AANH) superfamily ATPase
MKLLLHICCAPCIAAPYHELKGRGVDVTGFFYNPNIHPLLEFRKRLRAVEVFQEQEKFDVICRPEYGLQAFLRAIRPADEIGFDGSRRCRVCYKMRVDATAAAARQGGFDAFTTSLLFSRHQEHETIKAIAREAAEREGVEFYYVDLRHLADDSLTIARKRSLYRQQYCGCIFSEYERYQRECPVPNDRDNGSRVPAAARRSHRL